MKLIKRYWFAIFMLGISIVIGLIYRNIGFKVFNTLKFSFKEMIIIVPPVFVLLGLLDVWVPRETMTKYMGEDSGIVGVILSMFIGSAAAGPLYGAFPVASVFMKKGVKFSNVLIFIITWATTKLPLFLFELNSLGSKFALTRLAINIPGIFIIANIIAKAVEGDELKLIYQAAFERK